MSGTTVDTGRPFADAHVLDDLGDGRFRAGLDDVWAVGPKAFGGLLMVLMAKAGLAWLSADGSPAVDPLAVSADFLRAPDLAPVELEATPLKIGRTISSVAVRLTQAGKLMLHATVTAGVLPGGEPRWDTAVGLDPDPAADAVDPASAQGGARGLASACELRYPADALPFLRGETGPPEMSGWVRPRGEEPDVLFALLAGDILPPTVFNLGGRPGWAPTVQLTALLRGRPSPGWLRVDSRSRTVSGTQFDEDVTVVDATGRTVCQARQLALAPLGG
ncbi:TesB-like acyl-CoA thioesterase 3 [Pseudonocardia sp. Ae168_Ps1]|uniref:thioesterase family protein n=1 Tax=unclassified Pseudonocardia TaxID=2619320 RepID=UPI00094ABA73|nr:MULTISPECIES: thioesterase family protein [unclassified Pseudonocardia]OLL74301.1 TesB-like acyl-CoA thioesterase 3 [Pseudonocardia sp. Ae150A_Ps1]OLL80283.1 TesB-like acyl-CoA thioesterase 3 [Pseudonocardia sp. Ae168_Ps1]OLL85591.1 TesB-like acyl-CoA thioesterase 3 [Pseudonocardia sp. Ae263_Ps1]OLL94381.1 TesB-like acyl-CoA thioesterase 3 [Pseudonocardia sp. Ae356_Ps1]